MKTLFAALAMLAALPAMAGKPGTPSPAPPQAPTVMFVTNSVEVYTCDFIYMPGSLWFTGNEQAIFLRTTEGRPFTLHSGLSEQGVQLQLVEYLIKYGGLALTADDFRDAATGELDCTNAKLFSLLGG